MIFNQAHIHETSSDDQSFNLHVLLRSALKGGGKTAKSYKSKELQDVMSDDQSFNRANIHDTTQDVQSFY